MNRLTAAAAAIVAIAATVVCTLFLAPGPPELGDAQTGDVDLAARTRAAIGDPDGLRGLAVAVVAVVAVVENGCARLAGLGDADDGRPIDAETAFEPGSVTKTWTAMLLADMLATGDRYSNFGMSVLGHALAARAGTPYAALVTDRILTPIGMTATLFRPDGAAPPRPRRPGKPPPVAPSTRGPGPDTCPPASATGRPSPTWRRS